MLYSVIELFCCFLHKIKGVFVEFQVLMAKSIKIPVFWDIVLCSLVDID
jgi:hypothetical protein